MRTERPFLHHKQLLETTQSIGITVFINRFFKIPFSEDVKPKREPSVFESLSLDSPQLFEDCMGETSPPGRS